MIIIVEGKLGSGKTYWAVNYMLEKLYEYKEDIFQYVPKGNVRVISNIRNLELPHIDLDDEVKRVGGLEHLFCQDYEGLNDPNMKTIFIIDEAQSPEYFHRKYYNPKVFLFFQKSRHLGIDIILITQDKWTLSKEVQVLSEYNVQAIQRSVRTKNVFMYKYVIGNEVAKRKNIIFSKKVASLYKSFDKLENEKVNYLWKKYAVAVAICGLVIFISFKLAMGTFFSHGVNSQGRSPKPESASSPASTKGDDLLKQFEIEREKKQPGYKRSVPGTSDVSEKKEYMPKVSVSGSSSGVKVKDEREEREPLVPMKCEAPGDDGWQECFEGARYVGRFKAYRVDSTLPVYGKK